MGDRLMGQVDDFQKELERRSPGGYGKWFKVDLHNHSPSSFDYEDKSENAKDAIIEELRKPDKKLSMVMFTDHEVLPDREFCSAIQSATGTLILRGVEINCFIDAYDKGADKVGRNLYCHILIGFDPDGTHSPEQVTFTQSRHSRVIAGTGTLEGVGYVACGLCRRFIGAS